LTQEELMETDPTVDRRVGVDRHAGAVALAGVVIVVALALVAGVRDPEAMSLGVLAVIIFVSPFAMMAPMLPHNSAYRSAMGVALAATFILFWGIGAVGFMGTDNEHPNDLMYIVVPVVGIIGAIIARFRPHGMARAMLATALALMLVPVIVVIAGLNLVPISMSELISFTLVQNGLFAALYVGSALLFRKAARKQPPAEC
jgi:hypothetical protein